MTELVQLLVYFVSVCVVALSLAGCLLDDQSNASGATFPFLFGLLCCRLGLIASFPTCCPAHAGFAYPGHQRAGPYSISLGKGWAEPTIWRKWAVTPPTGTSRLNGAGPEFGVDLVEPSFQHTARPAVSEPFNSYQNYLTLERSH